MTFPHVYIDPAVEELMKLQSIFMKHFCKYLAVKIIHIKNSDLTFKISHILNHLMSLRFMNRKFIFIHTELLHQLHKSIYRKCIMLHGNAEFLAGLLFGNVFCLHQLVLLNHLPGIS